MRDYILRDDDFLVSQTDAKGRITFANEDFCRVCGYSLPELLGKPHNLVRHPDMPKAAFRDLWETIRTGKPWKGYVKNRHKDGGAYWVYAMVYPAMGCDDKLSGYISCRRKPSESEIHSAMELYRTMH